jgi:2-polyprenyl-3-methyl-5-hydroxy-6-metoxy-1,4-benzoquinol methylase
LPITRNEESLIDIGCGSGAFTIGASLRGYKALGLSWDERNQTVASERAEICKAPSAVFEVLDVRCLDQKSDFLEYFDTAICFENIEHILNDKKLIIDIFNCLKPGGRLLLTTPYYNYIAITGEDNGPFCQTETGWHVRRGYTKAMLQELCDISGFRVEEISFCSGFLSQKVAFIQRKLSEFSVPVAWLLTLPLRPLPPLLDGLISTIFKYPHYSICLEAYKPRFPKQ